MNIYIGSDHGGYNLKNKIIGYLLENNYRVHDLFCLDGKRCDYPDCAEVVCSSVLKGTDSLGIVICGTGIGISIAANKIKGIRCALCNDIFSAEMAKKHNNANVIAMGGRIIDDKLGYQILDKFLNSSFEGGRHKNRLAKLTSIEGKI